MKEKACNKTESGDHIFEMRKYKNLIQVLPFQEIGTMQYPTCVACGQIEDLGDWNEGK